MKLRDRIKSFQRLPKDKLRPAPYNWRTHPEKQRAALQGILEEIGFAGAILVRPLKDGTFMLIDGHLRLEEMPAGSKLPCLITDLSEKEAKTLLASYDPLSALAETDAAALGKLLKGIDVNSVALATMFSELAENTKALDVDDLELDVGETGGDGSEKFTELPSSHVRMIQLYLNTELEKRFEKFIATLGPAYGKDNTTDTVMEALRRESRRVKSEGAPERSGSRKSGGKKAV